MRKSAPTNRKFYYLFLGLTIFGILMVYDTSPLYAQRLGLSDTYRFVKLQAVWALAGLLFFGLVSLVSLQAIKKITRGLFVVALIFLTFLAGASLIYPCWKVPNPESDIAFCPCKNGARRWVNINPLPLPQLPLVGTFGFQATDLAKLAVVLYLPVLLESKMKSSRKKYEAFYYFLGYTLLVAGLVLAQPNMSNAILIVAIGMSIYFVSGLELKPLFYALPILMVVAIVLMLIIPHTRKRLVSLVTPHEQSTLDELYQSDQILIGLGAGGPLVWGLVSRSKSIATPRSLSAIQFLPSLAKRWALWAASCLLACLRILLIRCFRLFRPPLLYMKKWWAWV